MSESKGQMVCGFLFIGRRLMVVQKNHPRWQTGLLNGIGGHVESGETPDEAMIREFREEVGLTDLPWRCFCVEQEPFENAVVHFYAASVSNIAVVPPANDKGERISIVHVEDVAGPRFIGNLKWLVPMAMDPRRLDVLVTASGDIREKATW